MNSLLLFASFTAFLGLVPGSPYHVAPGAAAVRSVPLFARTDPYFPADPTSCPICEAQYSQISSCAQAAPVLANFTMVIFNPGAFIDVIKCACTDTFQSVFPQCVDCFTKTNQTDVLNTPDLPAVVSGMRNVCALESTLLGNVSNVDGETTPSSSAPAPTSSTSGGDSSLNPAVNEKLLWMTLAILGLSFIA
ncbi:hypothetical protein GLOTRDRAFT_76143 [Gloeophyllum trabeum ATCC 11539]|uniref:Uncharacterized protein n=1 Tax=Gloeophyllum trabeum (strain ATCC 11539 / FP-39264 / Madison 617) TaxID=670483 RepID=S7Q7E1_GLOTA|nr:uncharacterized protein GLOTRDRAFT_76143 [Gloeophyllum trabeum ATCC 11539]EPQ55926.1 hypothetical protein GLOTRDRAFT_76143 [Gloeophyllum trabeum ATCC 11539]